MSSRVLLDGSVPTGLTREFEISGSSRSYAAISVEDPSGTITLEIKTKAKWVAVDTIDAADPTRAIFSVGEFRVVATSLGATEVVVLHI